MRVFALSYLAVTCLSAGLVRPAAAGGIEYAGAGSQALGRGGAVTARADNPSVLGYNPAGLAELRGAQLMLSSNLALMAACVEPFGYYGWGVYNGGQPARLPDPSTGDNLVLNLGSTNDGEEGAYYSGKLDTVCLDQSLTPVPQFGFTRRIHEDLGIGFGLIFPAATPQGRWGGKHGIIRTDQGLRPAPTRYMQLSSGTLGVFPTLGIGFRIAPWLRIGAAFEWGIVSVDHQVTVAFPAGTSPAGDILVRVRASDWLIPAWTASAHLVPIDALDVVLAFRYQDNLDASGTADLTTGVFGPLNRPRTTHGEVDSVRQRMPWKLGFGVRYADRLAPRPRGTGDRDSGAVHGHGIRDAFQDERWDLELDAEYQMNARNRDQFIAFQPEQTVEFESLGGAVTAARYPDSTRDHMLVPKRWRDQWSVRLGATYNLMPGILGVSVGAHYENRGVDPSYMQIDYWPVSRVGLHAGIMIRIADSIDLTVAYAHIFQETLVVAAPPHAEGADISAAYVASGNDSDSIRAIDKRVGVAATRSEPAPILEEQPGPAGSDGTARLAQNAGQPLLGEPPWITNSGTYRSSLDVISVGLNVHL